MVVRSATVDDLPGILEIINREIREGVSHFGTEEMSPDAIRSEFNRFAVNYPWFVAVDGEGLVLGVARASPWKSRGAYARSIEVGVYVRPEMQGRGIATAIYGPFLEALRIAGFHTLLGGIGLPNEASIRLHEKFGFKHVGTLPEVGFKKGKWHSVGYWALTFPLEEPSTQSL